MPTHRVRFLGQAVEDFAQVFGLYPRDKYGHRSYTNIASVLWAEAGQETTDEFVKRVVFSVVMSNADMHLKNWTVLYPDRRTPVLSPAYDLVSTLPYLPNDELALNFGDSRNLHGITKDQVRRFAEAARIPGEPTLEDRHRHNGANGRKLEELGTPRCPIEGNTCRGREADPRCGKDVSILGKEPLLEDQYHLYLSGFHGGISPVK
jgi:HipA-like C-terminal domain